MTSELRERIYPLRRPKGFEPTVQRWSVAFPTKYDTLFVRFFGVQAADEAALNRSPFITWVRDATTRPDGPITFDHARHVDDTGHHTHITTGYWLNAERLRSWNQATESWWIDPRRHHDECGYFREQLTVPLDRQETLYWRDYPVGLSKSSDVGIFPTPYCGYYGAMRDRIISAAWDPLEASEISAPAPLTASTCGARWHVKAPRNLTVIRSGTFWGRCDPEQRDDFLENLRKPLEHGMEYLNANAGESGCLRLRYQQTCDLAGSRILETHALGYFTSLAHMEHWSERHPSHHAIFRAAMQRYRKYGQANQLRTWHEVFVLPQEGQLFEYINCHPQTGLLGRFEGERVG